MMEENELKDNVNMGKGGEPHSGEWGKVHETPFAGRKISEVEPIEEHPVVIRNRAQLEEFVEGPCLPACQVLYDKNINTSQSSANRKNSQDSHGEAWIMIDTELLSDRNKEILGEMIEDGLADMGSTFVDQETTEWFYKNYAYLRVPVNENSTVGEVSEGLMKIVDRFEQQDVSYGLSRFSFDEVLSRVIKDYIYFYKDSKDVSLKTDENGYYDPEAVIDEMKKANPEMGGDIIKILEGETGYVYDEETDEFWVSQEWCDKHKQYMKSKNS